MTHVVFAGGGTAGHIEPALNVAEELLVQLPTCEISMFGTARGLEKELVPARGFDLVLIPPTPLPRRLGFDLFSLPIRLWRSVRVCRAHLRKVDADLVVGFGGYVALPAYLAARAEGVPVIVHEANARPGLANRIGAKFAVTVIETVAGSLPNALHLGIPLRKSISAFNKQERRSAGIAEWKLNPNVQTVLVFGGSQGARHLNEVVAAAVPELVAGGVQVLHSVGTKNRDHLVEGVAGYVTVPYISDMAAAYAVADCAITRAGAMTVAELTALGIPAIYVPLPIGNGEQRLNALPVIEAGGGVLIDDSQLQANDIVRIVGQWTDERLAAAARAAAACGRADARAKIVQQILQVLHAKN